MRALIFIIAGFIAGMAYARGRPEPFRALADDIGRVAHKAREGLQYILQKYRARRSQA